MSHTVPNKPQVLRLYKTLINESKKMLAPGRRDWLVYRIRKEFRQNKGITEESRIAETYRLAEVHLDTIKVQVQHLNKPILEERSKKRSTVASADNAFDPFAEPADDIEESPTETPNSIEYSDSDMFKVDDLQSLESTNKIEKE